MKNNTLEVRAYQLFVEVEDCICGFVCLVKFRKQLDSLHPFSVIVYII
jgi:hypothetical protein